MMMGDVDGDDYASTGWTSNFDGEYRPLAILASLFTSLDTIQINGHDQDRPAQYQANVVIAAAQQTSIKGAPLI
jgi:hypothetical protein